MSKIYQNASRVNSSDIWMDETFLFPKKLSLKDFVKIQIHKVTNSLKKHSKWAFYTYEEFPTNEPILTALIGLNTRLNEDEVESLSPLQIVDPFLLIIRADDSPATATCSALSALRSIVFKDEFLAAYTFDYAFVKSIIGFITKCQFESCDSASDEMVMVEIVKIITSLVKSATFCSLLSNEIVCEIVEVLFSICLHPKISDLLKKLMLQRTCEVLRILFSRLAEISADAAELCDGISTLKIGGSFAANSPITNATLPLKIHVQAENGQITETEHASPQQPSIDAYGLPIIREIIRYLASLLQESCKDTISVAAKLPFEKVRLFALEVISDIVEYKGDLLFQFDSIFAPFATDIIEVLLFLLADIDCVNSCKIILNIFTCCFLIDRRKMSVYLPCFINTLLDRVKSDFGKSRSAELNEVFLLALNHFFANRSYLFFIYAAFDCNSSEEFLCEKLLTAYASFNSPSSAYNINGYLTNLNYLAIESLLAFVRNCYIVAKCNVKSDAASFLLDEYKKKKASQECALAFNQNPTQGIQQLVAVGLASSKDDYFAIAKFLYDDIHLDIGRVGLFLSKSTDYNKSILLAYMGNFNFAGLRVDGALRILLRCFRLPGESQQIWNIMEAFAAIYSKQSGREYGSKDSVFVLAYAIIMLNTDLHNSRVKNKMKLEEFVRNNMATSEVTGAVDFSAEYLTEIYESIRGNEIILPDDQVGIDAFRMRWFDSQPTFQDGGKHAAVLSFSSRSSPHDYLTSSVVSHILKSFLDQIIVSVFYVIKETKSAAIFDQCKELLFILFCFCKINAGPEVLAHNQASFEKTLLKLTEHLNVSDFDITDSKFSDLLRFVLVIIVKNVPLLTLQCWKVLFDILEKLFTYNLIPKAYLSVVDFTQQSKQTFLVDGSPSGGDSGSSSLSSKKGAIAVKNSNFMGAISNIFGGRSSSIAFPSSPSSGNSFEDFSLALEKEGSLFGFVQDTEMLSDRMFESLLITIIETKCIDSKCDYFFMEIYFKILCQNKSRIEKVFKNFFNSVTSLMERDSISIRCKERILAGIIRVIQQLTVTDHQKSVDDQIQSCILYLKAILTNSSLAPQLANQIISGIVSYCEVFVESHIKSEILWNSLFSIMQILAAKEAWENEVLKGLQILIESEQLDNFKNILEIVDGLVSSKSESNSTKAFHLMYTCLIKMLLNPSKATGIYEESIFFVLRCYSKSLLKSSPIKQVAMTSLQRAFLHSDLLEIFKGNRIEKFFNQIIFPSMLEVSDAEIRQRLTGLSSKVLLFCLNNDLINVKHGSSEFYKVFFNVWMRLLEMYQIYFSADNDFCREAVKESCKNLLLVLLNMGVLQKCESVDSSAEAAKSNDLWEETWKNTKKIVPDLYYEHYEQKIPTPEDKQIDIEKTGYSNTDSQSHQSPQQPAVGLTPPLANAPTTDNTKSSPAEIYL